MRISVTTGAAGIASPATSDTGSRKAADPAEIRRARRRLAAAALAPELTASPTAAVPQPPDSVTTAAAPAPHGGQVILRAGEPLGRAHAAMVLVHGRGATARDILSLRDELDVNGFAFLAPQATGSTWYPNSFLAPIATNEPGLSSGLAVLGALVAGIEAAGIAPERTILLGFSQGACLALEFSARNARRYGAVVGLSGALIGPPETPREHTGLLAGTPVFLGCSDRDPHVPAERVLEAARVLRALGGAVTERLYPGMGHTVNADELGWVRARMQELLRDDGVRIAQR